MKPTTTHRAGRRGAATAAVIAGGLLCIGTVAVAAARPELTQADLRSARLASAARRSSLNDGATGAPQPTGQGNVFIERQPIATAALAVIVTVIALLATSSSAGASASLQFGAYTPGDPYGANVAGTEALQTALGRRVDIVNWYQSWGGGDWVSSVQPSIIKAVTNSGRAPLLTWEPWNPADGATQPEFSLAHIGGGAFDAYIARWADGLKAIGATIYLRPMHEMNGTWYPWSGTVDANNAAQYIQAWRHMHDIFAARGATNVKWVFSPNNTDVPRTLDNAMEAYYPGAEYVDVLAVDGYNWGSESPQNGGWQSFGQVFSAALDRLAKLGSQPLWIAEVGSDHRGGDKATWIKDAFASAKAIDRLQAMVWFNENKERDWRAAPSADVAAAFKPGNEAFAPAPAAAAPAPDASTAGPSRSAARSCARSAPPPRAA